MAELGGNRHKYIVQLLISMKSVYMSTKISTVIFFFKADYSWVWILFFFSVCGNKLHFMDVVWSFMQQFIMQNFHFWMVFNQKFVCLENCRSDFPSRCQQVWTHSHWEKNYLTLLQMSFRKRKLLMVIRTSYRKLCPGMFIQFFSFFQVIYASHLRKYLSLVCFRFHLMMSFFYMLSRRLFNSKLLKVVSGWLHCCGSHVTEWHQPLKQSWPPAKWKLFLFSPLRVALW